ncbi:16S rRNA (guanine(966)-N(2))-methyltransferase RsmD [Ferrimonas balearica]|uniref:16S rRNA (guanine(966)-N(2))-methyltransferase RsmD n=1 Tax=Ferrimonas balearica TaxID=44012 RepID=UPI001C954B5A|nr:16S rRNA (guanine(966)-N(2))-methyltransferase RsmD [Ferrimonas balearica]MBY6226018.1 16S rRNA (guanine(966)-N(2))-methyltransferase RsmD [Ferrimonas balearica]
MARAPRRNANPRSETRTPGQIRLIGGQWRGRKLPVTDVVGLRPTTDRVRETLFNWLMQDTRGARVLDCFAGSGALSLEALSRFAASATMLELDSAAARQLVANLATLKADNGKVISGDSLAFLAKPAEAPYDIVFIDPPFRKGLLAPCIEHLSQNGYLRPGTWIYLETESELDMPALPAGWSLHREKVAGQVAFRLYQYRPTENPV